MNDETQIPEIANNANQTASRGVGGLHQHFGDVDERFGNSEWELAAIRNGHQASLDVVWSIDRQLRDSKTILTRVDRLERTVFRR
jgi:hypothetical protein